MSQPVTISDALTTIDERLSATPVTKDFVLLVLVA